MVYHFPGQMYSYRAPYSNKLSKSRMPNTYPKPAVYNNPSKMTQDNYPPFFFNASHPNSHVHAFSGTTTLNDGHKHPFAGTTDPGPNGVQHTHKYWTVTEFADKHRHELKGETGPAIPLANGGHTHFLKGETYGYPSHQHFYETKTKKSMS